MSQPPLHSRFKVGRVALFDLPGLYRVSGLQFIRFVLQWTVMFRLVYTVNMCSVDLSKAFDKMSHHGLFIKLMEKYIPVNLLSLLLERWFALSETCVKWGQVVSSFVNLCGVRQGGRQRPYVFIRSLGGVLSPYLFFIDSIIDKIKSSGLGCYVKWTCISLC